MATTSHWKVATVQRRRTAARGLVRVEVQARTCDVGLIRDLAETLRSDPERAKALRVSIRSVLERNRAENALDVFGSYLADDAFEGVFAASRDRGWRKVDL